MDQVAAMLAPFGIVVGARLGVSSMVYRPAGSDVLVKEVGEVLRRPDGSVLVCPRRDASDAEVVALLQAGELGCRETPSAASGWERRRHQGQVWWQHTLLLTVTDRDPYWWAYRTAEVPSEAAARETAALAVGE